MVRVTIPASLREHAGGRKEEEVRASTVQEALQRLGERHAALRTHLFDDRGRVRGHVNIFVGPRRVTDPASASLGEGDEVKLVPSIAGG